MRQRYFPPFLESAALLSLLVLLVGCQSGTPAPAPQSLGRFNVEKDLFLAQFDSKTDVDDIQSVAAVATMLADPRFSRVRYHAVAGAYGIQDGLYVPANELFELAFGSNWSDAHTDYERALGEVSALVTETLKKGGTVWIADAGQSDFTADIVRQMEKNLQGIDLKERIHVVQHADWNEKVTAPEKLAYVKVAASYHKIPDGNAVGNGTPGFRTDEPVAWREYVTSSKGQQIWELAITIANRYNAKDGRYDNTAIGGGGMDFSDVSETCWIFGFAGLTDAEAFFREFATR
ncbi:hypothetical protein G0Q06_02720 [Puniceicoccales bacterium CK1056]|uniref:Uncharacterized protein n=1 Tax=Oceanipulchritudo coccoides TaxID=2706888 RepID=A0A6B2M0U0_9BACT|nr:hypothetical protein [Oceanipulchritudo coccoides]NDV61360.1 hypothetical protein [Oceanipulchritudo coccoides]